MRSLIAIKSMRRASLAIAGIFVVTGSIAWLSPSPAGSRQDAAVEASESPSKPLPQEVALTPEQQQAKLTADQMEQNQLIRQLKADHLVDEVKGFTVEKIQNQLYINGQRQADEVASKYLSAIKQSDFSVQVPALLDKLRMHPEKQRC